MSGLEPSGPMTDPGAEVHARNEVRVNDIAVALRMIGRKSDVFVEGESLARRKDTRPARNRLTSASYVANGDEPVARPSTASGLRVSSDSMASAASSPSSQGIGSDDDFHQAAISLSGGVLAASIEKYCA